MNPNYLLADDLSGALEAGASFRRAGHLAGIPLEPCEVPGLAVITSETRNAAAAPAYDTVARILREQTAAGRRLLLKKIDSTLRGPLAAELRAVAEVLHPPAIVVCPANPATGRTVRDGILLVEGLPLAATPFRHDPIWPTQASAIAPHLSACGLPVSSLGLDVLRNGNAAAVLGLRAPRPRLLVCDAETTDDLDRLVKAVTETLPDAVLVGSNGLAQSLALRQPVLSAPPPIYSDKLQSLVILCGTRHPATHRQVESLLKAGLADVITVRPGEMTPAATATELQSRLRQHRVIALRFDANESMAHTAPQLFVAELLRHIPAIPPPAGFLFSGGETAWTACRALGGSWLDIQQPWEDAIVASTLQGLSRPLAFYTKPGGYGDSEMLTRFVRILMK